VIAPLLQLGIHGSFGYDLYNAGLVSQQVWHVKKTSLLKATSLGICSPITGNGNSRKIADKLLVRLKTIKHVWRHILFQSRSGCVYLRLNMHIPGMKFCWHCDHLKISNVMTLQWFWLNKTFLKTWFNSWSRKKKSFVGHLLSIIFFKFYLFIFLVVRVNKLYWNKKDNSRPNVSSYPECVASKLSFHAKVDFRSRNGNIQILFHTSNESLFKCISDMISVGDNQASCQRRVGVVL
jgi:hypothetical protein